MWEGRWWSTTPQHHWETGPATSLLQRSASSHQRWSQEPMSSSAGQQEILTANVPDLGSSPAPNMPLPALEKEGLKA